MRGGGKGRHGQLGFAFGRHYFSCFGVKAHGLSARQQKKFAFFRQGHEFVRAWQPPLRAPATDHEQAFVIVNIALLVRHDKMRLNMLRGHKCSLPRRG